jgi:hypothetical protein
MHTAGAKWQAWAVEQPNNVLQKLVVAVIHGQLVVHEQPPVDCIG